MRRQECHDRIRQVTGSYQTVLHTVQVLIRLGERQPQNLYEYNLSLTDLRRVLVELHDLYFARTFACFESSIRHFWRANVRDTRPPTEQLLAAVATRRQVPQDTLDAVQQIRSFRNYLIHEEYQVTTRFTIDDASRHLNAYLARLPLEW